MRLILMKYGTLFITLALLVGCGLREQETERINRIGESSQQDYEYVPVEVDLVERKEQSSEDLDNGFQLTLNLLANASAGEFLPKCNDAQDFSGNDFSPNSQSSLTTYVPVGLYCRIEIKKFTLNGVIYTYQDNVTDGTWETASTKYQYQDGNGNIVNLKVTANTLFNDSGEYVQIASSGSYAISASLVFVDQESSNVLRASQTSISISGNPVPEFTASATTGFAYDSDNSAWNFRINLTLACDNGWSEDNSSASSSTCKENSAGAAVAMSDLKFNKTEVSEIASKNDTTLGALSYTDVADSDVSLDDNGLKFTLNQVMSDASFPSSTDAYRYLILKRGTDAYSVFEYVLKKTN